MNLYDIDVEDLKEAYPNPKPAGEGEDGDCCVGGSLCRHLAYVEEDDCVTAEIPMSDLSFPSPDKLAHALQCANPDLTEKKARKYAEKITEQNDDEKFGRAWATLERALNDW